jgi:hypothetical protein
MTGYVTKPFVLEELVEALAAACGVGGMQERVG